MKGSLWRTASFAALAVFAAGGLDGVRAGAGNPWTIVSSDGRTFTAPGTTAGGGAHVPRRVEGWEPETTPLDLPDLPPIRPLGGRLGGVIGADGRTQVLTTTAYPFSATASLVVSFPGYTGSCTGWFIGPHTLATAGHCVYDTGTDTWASSITVIPGRDGDAAPFGSFPASAWASVDGWTAGHNWNYDYGAVRISVDAGDVVGWYGCRSARASDDERRVWIAGYPGDKPDGTLWRMRGRIKKMTRRKLFYPIDTSWGQSGAPVFFAGKGGARSVGIHAYTYGQRPFRRYNSGTRFTKALLGNLRFWRNDW